MRPIDDDDCVYNKIGEKFKVVSRIFLKTTQEGRFLKSNDLKGFLKISHHRIIIIAERLRPRTEQRRFKRRRRIKRTETHRWSRQNREPG